MGKHPYCVNFFNETMTKYSFKEQSVKVKWNPLETFMLPNPLRREIKKVNDFTYIEDLATDSLEFRYVASKF